MTEWRPVPGYEGLYEISYSGQVWSAPRPRTRGGLLRQYGDGHGYRCVTLTRNGTQKRFGVHQLVALAWHGPCPPGMEVCHGDGDKLNNRADNLAYGTHGKNMLDRVAHGRSRSANKTHCPQNHPYDDANTVIYQGRRFCLTCRREKGREAQRRLRQRRKAAA